jgi:hypothetical protein
MAGDDHTDLFMTFIDAMGQQVIGESRTELSSSDPITRQMLLGFLHNKFIEIDSFSMSARVDDADEAEMRREILKENRRAIDDYNKRKKSLQGVRGEQPPEVIEKGSRKLKELVDTRKNQAAKGSPVKEINFSRQVDIASGAFTTGIRQGYGYKSATLIKRKGAGSKDETGKATSGDVYLRIEFEQVLVTSVDWSDDEGEIKESCKFICKEITVKYRPQLPSGKLGAIQTGHWVYTDRSQQSTGFG